MTSTGVSAPGRGGHPAITFAVLSIGVMSFSLLQALLIPVLSWIQTEFDTDQTTVTWVLTSYLLSASICTPILGRLGDAVGKKRVLVIAMSALAIGSLMAAMAPTIEWLVAARIVQGAGGGVLPLTFGIIRDEFAGRVKRALSMVVSMTAVGWGAGLVFSGPIVTTLGYRWLFWLPLTSTAIAALAALTFIPESPPGSRGRLPFVPATLLAIFLVTLLLALSEGNAWGWTSRSIVALFATAVVSAVAWVWSETRVSVPMIDLTMMRSRGVWTTNLVVVFVGFGMFASQAFLPQFLQSPSAGGYGFDASLADSGRLLLPTAVMSFLMGFVAAPLCSRFGARLIIVAANVLIAVAFTSIALWHDATWQLYVATTMQGIGSGLVLSSVPGIVIASVPPVQTGVAGGMNANIRTIGGCMGSAAMAAIVTARTGPSGLPAEAGYVIGFLALSAAMLAAAAASTMIPDLRPQTRPNTETEDTDLGRAAMGPIP